MFKMVEAAQDSYNRLEGFSNINAMWAASSAESVRLRWPGSLSSLRTDQVFVLRHSVTLALLLIDDRTDLVGDSYGC